jgi:hypothetical protein
MTSRTKPLLSELNDGSVPGVKINPLPKTNRCDGQPVASAFSKIHTNSAKRPSTSQNLYTLNSATNATTIRPGTRKRAKTSPQARSFWPDRTADSTDFWASVRYQEVSPLASWRATNSSVCWPGLLPCPKPKVKTTLVLGNISLTGRRENLQETRPLPTHKGNDPLDILLLRFEKNWELYNLPGHNSPP